MKRNLTAILASLSVIATVISVPSHKIFAASQTSITRSQVEQRAISLVDLQWTYSADKNSNISSQYASSVTLPKQFEGVTNAQFTGIPYDWGGIDGVDTYSYNAPWTNFLDAISKGAFAGNVNSQGNLGYVAGTAGMDCSGFVQAAFNIKDWKQSSSSILSNYFTQIDINSLQHMDILDRPGDHVVIFDKWGTLNGRTGAFTYEATTDQTYGGIQGTKRYFISMDTINKGYIPARYKYILDDTNTLPTSDTSLSSTSAPTATTSASSAATSTTPTPAFTVGGYAQVTNVTYYANLRSNPGTNYSILTTIPKGTILSLNDYSNGWYKVYYNGNTGWIYGNILGSVPVNKYVTVNGVYMLNIRMTPSGTAQILGVITQGQYAQKLDQTSDGSWYKISINGLVGWSSSKYLIFIK